MEQYIAAGCVPGGTERNHASYGEYMQTTSDEDRALLCDPQTSGGLLVAVASGALTEFEQCLEEKGLALECIGEMLPAGDGPTLLVA